MFGPKRVFRSGWRKSSTWAGTDIDIAGGSVAEFDTAIDPVGGIKYDCDTGQRYRQYGP